MPEKNMEDKIVPPTPEELQAETEAQKEAKEDEIRTGIINDLGLDEVDDADKIEKLVKREVDHRKNLSTAIGQKVKYRELATKGAQPPANSNPPKPQGIAPEDVEKTVDAKVTERLEKRDLDAMKVSETVKTEIKRIAQMTGKSVLEVARDPYIVNLIDSEEKTAKAEEAAVGRTGNTGGKKSWNVNTPPEVDMSTAEGRKTYDEWKAWAIGQGA